jgi:prepilin-type processing-associated H-X9-DG protein
VSTPREAPSTDGLADDQLHGRACWHPGAHSGPLYADGHVYTEPSEPGAPLGWAVVACAKHRGRP